MLSAEYTGLSLPLIMRLLSLGVLSLGLQIFFFRRQCLITFQRLESCVISVECLEWPPYKRANLSNFEKGG